MPLLAYIGLKPAPLKWKMKTGGHLLFKVHMIEIGWLAYTGEPSQIAPLCSDFAVDNAALLFLILETSTLLDKIASMQAIVHTTAALLK